MASRHVSAFFYAYFRTSCPEVGKGRPGCRSPPAPVQIAHPQKSERRLHIMTTINLKDFYSWYTTDEYIEVSDEVAAELRAESSTSWLTSAGSSVTRCSIPSTVMMGSNTLRACPSRRRRSCWSAWSVSALSGTPSTPCRRSRAAVWMPVSFSARAIGKLHRRKV